MFAKRLVHVIHRIPVFLAVCVAVGIHPSIAVADLASSVDFNIAPQQLPSALLKYSEQSGVQVSSSGEIVEAKMSEGVIGKHSARDGLDRLLKGTNLRYDVVDANTVAIRSVLASSTGQSPQSKSAARLAQAHTENWKSNADAAAPSDSGPKGSVELEEIGVSIPEILVTGSKILNADIRRSVDDPQPYVVFDREKIEISGATTVEDFLKQRLPMNTVQGTNQQQAGSGFSGSSLSQINLRGLGANQTLILVDGRRMAGVFNGAGFDQSDINGIPLDAVERIEVLPTTASGIYGGGATGGVVNIILRRDYAGIDTKLTYDNTFDTDSARRRVDVSAGFNLEGGKTNVLLTGTYHDTNPLLVADREMLRRGRETVLANTGGNYRALEASGRPPFGALPNIRSVTGENLTLKDGTPLNSPITHAPAGYAGAASDMGMALLANAGRYNLDVTSAATGPLSGGEPAMQQTRVESAMLTIRRQFTPRLAAFLDGSALDNTAFSRGGLAIFGGTSSSLRVPATAPTNPFQQDIIVAVPNDTDANRRNVRSTVRRIGAGLIAKLPGDWMGQADYTWSRSGHSVYSPPSQFLTSVGQPVRDGALDLLRDPSLYPIDFSPYLDPITTTRTAGPWRLTLKDAMLRFGGPVGSWPAGRPALSLSIGHREEVTSDNVFVQRGITNLFPSRSQSVDSAYAEIRLPLVSDKNPKPGIQALELQLSGRWDEYTTHGVTSALINPTPGSAVRRSTNKVSSIDPTVALRYQPVHDVALRVSYGTGFLPPGVHQILPNPPQVNCTENDPLRGNTPATYTCIGGGNPDLRPEDSESWSAGAIFTPRFIPGLRLSVDYTRVKKTDNITSPPGLADLITFFPERITRGPKLATDPASWAGPIISTDGTLVNVAQAQVEAYDVQLDYALQTPTWGRFEFFGIATRQTEFTQQFLPNSPVVNNLGVVDFPDSTNPLKFKANAGLIWKQRQWTLGWVANYFDSYWLNSAHAVVVNQGSAKVDSQIYHDAFASYRFNAAETGRWISNLLRNTEFTAGVKNVFNEMPPFAANTVRYYSFYGDPRLASYYLSVQTSFR